MANTTNEHLPDAEHVARIEAARYAMSQASRNRYIARRNEVEAERARLRAVGMNDRYAIANVARRHGITAAALRNVITKGTERWPDDCDQQ